MRKSFSSLTKNHELRRDVFLVEKVVGLEVEQAYTELKALLLKEGGKIMVEESPVHISVKQGSLWGIFPRSAKKVVHCRLFPQGSGTRIACSSSLTSDWINLAVIGSVLSAILALLCWWISVDLAGYIITQKPSYWSWIAAVNGYSDFQVAQAFVGLTRMFTVFLALIIILEVAIAVYAHFRINDFAEKILDSLR
jgi:hypothetical protein